MTVNYNGTDKTVYLATHYEVTVDSDDPSAVSVPFAQYAFLYDLDNCENKDTIDPSCYWKPNLLGGTIRYTVDFSNVGCNCVQSVFLTAMPYSETDDDGTVTYIAGPSGLYQCGALGTSGYTCNEIDIMLANKYAYQAELHNDSRTG